jgi:hypothetical protein
VVPLGRTGDAAGSVKLHEQVIDAGAAVHAQLGRGAVPSMATHGLQQRRFEKQCSPAPPAQYRLVLLPVSQWCRRRQGSSKAQAGEGAGTIIHAISAWYAFTPAFALRRFDGVKAVRTNHTTAPPQTLPSNIHGGLSVVSRRCSEPLMRFFLVMLVHRRDGGIVFSPALKQACPKSAL